MCVLNRRGSSGDFVQAASGSSAISKKNGSASRNPELSTSFHTGLTHYLRRWSTTRIQQRLGYLGPDEYRAQNSSIA